MLHVVQFSGGAASAYVASMVIKEHGKENTILLFHDTKAEHKDAKRFREEVSNRLDVPITEASDGRDLWQVIKDHHCLPSFHIPFCTEDLKLKPAEKYYKNLNGIDFILYNGFGYKEWKRVQKATARAESLNRKVVSPLFLNRISDVFVKETIKNDWKICLPQPYKYLKHNNCIPCFKAGMSHFYKVWLYYPNEFEMAKKAEQEIGATIFKKSTLEELEKQWRAGLSQISFEQWEEDAIPCMCAL